MPQAGTKMDLECWKQLFSIVNFQSSVKFTKRAFKSCVSQFFNLGTLYSSVFLDSKWHYLKVCDWEIYDLVNQSLYQHSKFVRVDMSSEMRIYKCFLLLCYIVKFVIQDLKFEGKKEVKKRASKKIARIFYYINSPSVLENCVTLPLQCLPCFK